VLATSKWVSITLFLAAATDGKAEDNLRIAFASWERRRDEVLQ
jgi:hypothetical protein